MAPMPMQRAPMPGSTGRMPMHRAPMLNSASGLRHPLFNDRREDRLEARRFFHNRSTFVFIGDFGFPWWWGWGWGPWWSWGYPYGYYGGYNYGDYGSGYGDSSQSRVAELQRRLARAGFYHGAIDGIMGPATRRAIRAYERDHGYVG
jgi:Putative peptidoglycan binding domain